MSRPDLQRIDDELDRLAARGLDSATFRREAMLRLTRVVPADGYCFSTADPGTLVMTSHVTAGVPRDQAWRVYRNEYAEADVSKHADLAAGGRPVRILARETGGEPERSPRYRSLLRPMGMEHELRAAATEHGATWGFVHLFRAPGRPGFSADEEAVLARVGRRLAAGLRAASLRGLADLVPASQSPGVIVLDERGGVRLMSGGAEAWLAGVRDPELPAGAVPDVLLTLAEWAGERSRRGDTGTAARVHTRAGDGAWWSLHASCPTYSREARGDVVIVVQPASGPEMADMALRALGLSPGEREVAALVLAGCSTKEIAERLIISPWTVQDRLKGIFARTGVRSRRDLVARLTGA